MRERVEDRAGALGRVRQTGLKQRCVEMRACESLEPRHGAVHRIDGGANEAVAGLSFHDDARLEKVRRVETMRGVEELHCAEIVMGDRGSGKSVEVGGEVVVVGARRWKSGNSVV